MQYSVATNISYVRPDALTSNEFQPSDSDPDVLQVLTDTLPESTMSVMLTKDGVKKICGEMLSYTTYSKAFNAGFSNFRCEGIPSSFSNCTTTHIRPIGVLGYSTAAHILRRTSKTEPFSSRPVAHYLQSTTDNAKRKYRGLIQKQLNDLEGGVANMEQTGTSYRIELTFEIETDNWDDLQQEMDQKLDYIRDTSIQLLYEHAILVPSNVFPKAIAVFSKEIFKNINETIEKMEENPDSVTICEKEFSVLLENLVSYPNLATLLYKWESPEHFPFYILFDENKK
jgi:hypothetical protein